jgi:Tfp pilus assembly protein PilV
VPRRTGRSVRRIVATVRGAAARRTVARDDEGFTLLDVVIAMIVMALAVVGVLGALTVVAASSFMVSERADVGIALRSAVEAVKAHAYVACNATPTPVAVYQTYIRTPTVVTLPKFNGKPTVLETTVTVHSLTCSTRTTSLQTIRITVASRDHKVLEGLTFVKLNLTTSSLK